ncbi:MAG: hypothetical protein PUF50_00090 [Erysipelotrichaceae bacterium]|nr:hypothetical protein [Erysipelotrichaceae bacterium]
MLSLIRFNLHERKIFEDYLNDQAQKGYALQWFNRYLIAYKKTNQIHNYAVVYSTQKQDDIPIASDKRFTVYDGDRVSSPLSDDPSTINSAIKSTQQNLILLHVLIPIVILITAACYLYSQQFVLIDVISHNETLLLYLFQLLLIPISLFVNRISFIHPEHLKQSIRRIKIRTWIQLFSMIILYFSSFFLCYLFVKEEELISLIMVSFPIIILLVNVVPKVLKQNKGVAGLFIVSSLVIISLMCCMKAFDDAVYLNPFYKYDPHHPNFFSEQITGKVESSYYQHAESFLLRHDTNYISLEPKEECPIDYDCNINPEYLYIEYFEPKVELLRPLATQTLDSYYQFSHNTILDVEVYQRIEDEPIYDKLYVFHKGNRYLYINTFSTLEQEQITKMIKELGW